MPESVLFLNGFKELGVIVRLIELARAFESCAFVECNPMLFHQS
ncbi:hypothetical protein [Bartonella sp. AP213QHHD]